MGWAHGERSDGRLIGYGEEGKCDEPGCEAVISLGVDAACGGMHGADEFSCDEYFCGKHLYFHSHQTAPHQLCAACLKALEPDPEDCEGDGQIDEAARVGALDRVCTKCGATFAKHLLPVATEPLRCPDPIGGTP